MMAESENKNIVLLFLTRAFDEDQFAYNSRELDSSSIDQEYFGIGTESINDSPFFSNISKEDQKGIKIESSELFWKSFIDKYKYSNDSSKILHPNFHGKLKQLEIKRESGTLHPNVFFYHHWFDRQVRWNNYNVVCSFIYNIVEQIKKIIFTDEDTQIEDLRLVLHHGDFIQYENDAGEICKLEEKIIIDILSIISKKITIYIYHHTKAYLEYNRVLNNSKLYNKLKEDLKIINIEEYILSLFDPDSVNNKFINFFQLHYDKVL